MTGRVDGMGIGLSVSHSIVEAHGGTIWAEDNPGGGTTFRFTLPVTSVAGSGSPDNETKQTAES